MEQSSRVPSKNWSRRSRGIPGGQSKRLLIPAAIAASSRAPFLVSEQKIIHTSKVKKSKLQLELNRTHAAVHVMLPGARESRASTAQYFRQEWRLATGEAGFSQPIDRNLRETSTRGPRKRPRKRERLLVKSSICRISNRSNRARSPTPNSPKRHANSFPSRSN
ncbi:hypothetical protein BDW62DRAFT_133268 [Aspergillus aurantiobrunneus]